MNNHKLSKAMKESIKTMTDACDTFPWQDPKSYANLLAQTYFYTRHATRILGLAAVHFDHDREEQHRRFMKHASEEKGHERLALNDLRHLGFDIAQFPESPATMALYQSQYYWIQHVEPSAVFGFVLALEAYAVEKCPWMYETCKKIHGEKASMFWKVHAEEDPDHVERAVEQIVKLDDSLLKNVEVNLTQTAFNYSAIYKEIAKSAPKSLAA